MENRIIAYIFNHNHNENCKNWLRILSDKGIECYIIDSGSDKPIEGDDRVLKFENLYYGGCYKKMTDLFLQTDANWVLQINDDIYIDEGNFEKMLLSFNSVMEQKNVGIYQPSTTNESHNDIPMNINKGTNSIRYTYRIEGWMGLIHRDVLSATNYILRNNLKIGWGIDVLSSYICRSIGKKIVVDDGVIVKHPKGDSGYNRDAARAEMEKFFRGALGMSYDELNGKTLKTYKEQDEGKIYGR